ncbi:DivIVA domain-containing protein [Syntrophomonas erecta]
MITGMEIRNQQFRKALRGLDETEVKNYLMRVAQDYEVLYTDNSRLKEEIQRLEYELARYKKMEETMNSSLILAQQTAEDLKNSARKEADLILGEARKKISTILMVYQDIIKRLNLFNVELKAQINGELDLLERNQHKIDELSSFFYSKDLKELMEHLETVTMEEKEE